MHNTDYLIILSRINSDETAYVSDVQTLHRNVLNSICWNAKTKSTFILGKAYGKKYLCIGW